MVREFVKTDNTGQIDALLHVLGQDFTMSHSPNSRKGGLIGLAAVSIAIGKVCAILSFIDLSHEIKCRRF